VETLSRKIHFRNTHDHGRDFFVDEVLKEYRGQLVKPVSLDAELRSS